MKTLITFILTAIVLSGLSAPDANEILKKVDKNLSSDNRVMESQITIQGKRGARTITSKTYAMGEKKSFTEYLSPAREQGTKMLKLENQLWIYSPSTDRIIQISGHMLRQSVMGSDLSYEDMMDDRKLTDVYNAAVIGTQDFSGRPCWVLELRAKGDDAAYYQRKMWIDTERSIPLKEEWFAKGGKLLKQTTLSDVKKIQGRWFPTKVT